MRSWFSCSASPHDLGCLLNCAGFVHCYRPRPEVEGWQENKENYPCRSPVCFFSQQFRVCLSVHRSPRLVWPLLWFGRVLQQSYGADCKIPLFFLDELVITRPSRSGIRRVWWFEPTLRLFFTSAESRSAVRSRPLLRLARCGLEECIPSRPSPIVRLPLCSLPADLPAFQASESFSAAGVTPAREDCLTEPLQPDKRCVPGVTRSRAERPREFRVRARALSRRTLVQPETPRAVALAAELAAAPFPASRDTLLKRHGERRRDAQQGGGRAAEHGGNIRAGNDHLD